MGFVDHGPVQRGAEARRATVAVIHPDLHDVHFVHRELLHRPPRLGLGRDLVGDPRVGGCARPRVRRADAPTRDQQLRATEHAGRLIGADPIQHVAALDSLRLHDRDTEVQGAIEVVHHGVTREVRRFVREAPLESRVHMRADQGGHHGFAREIDHPGFGADARRDLRGRSDRYDFPAAHGDGLCDGALAVDGDHRAVDQRQIHAGLRSASGRDRRGEDSAQQAD